MKLITVSSRPSISVAQAFVIPEKLLWKFRLLIYPQQIVHKTISEIRKDGLVIQFVFSSFVVKKTLTVQGMGLVNHQNEFFSYGNFSMPCNLLLGESFNPIYTLSLGISEQILPAFTRGYL